MGRMIGSLLDTGTRGANAHITKGYGVTAHEMLERKGNMCVTHQDFCLEMHGENKWKITPKFLSHTGCVRGLMFLGNSYYFEIFQEI